MGVNSLRDTVKNMCKSAGFEGNFINHSLCSTCATRMYESGMEEQVIAEVTGHRSLCVWSYKCTSTLQKRQALQALSGESKLKKSRFEHKRVKEKCSEPKQIIHSATCLSKSQ